MWSQADFPRLEGYLKVLAYGRRLELLAQLRTPKTLDEIRLTPGLPQAGLNPERPITRQGVQNHLDQLVAAGIVRVQHTTRKGRRPVQEYVVDRSKLFALVDELRAISAFEELTDLDPLSTVHTLSWEETEWPEGPKLVLVRGVGEGKAFALLPSQQKQGRGWVVGRGDRATVALDYDPFVSAENAELLRAPDGTFRLLDLRTARNGCYLNWKRLPPGGEAVLRSGDILGVGRSLLVFRAD